MLVAGDTFRAAAAEQLAEWASRSGAALVAAQSPKQKPYGLLSQAMDQARRSYCCPQLRVTVLFA